MLTYNDRARLNQLRIDRLTSMLPQLAGLPIQIAGQNLYISLPSNLFQLATWVVGVSTLNLCRDSEILYSANLQSNKEDGESMAVALEDRQITSNDTNELVSWRAIASKTNESEAEIKKRCCDLGVSFQWMEEEDWGVFVRDAQTLACRYFTDMGEAIARSFSENPENPPVVLEEVAAPATVTAPGSNEKSEPETAKPKRKSPKPTISFIGEFKPVKNLKTSAEKYLQAISPDLETQTAILNAIVTDTNEARRHLNKALAAYPDELKDATTRAKLQAAFTALYERTNNPPKERKSKSTEATPDTQASEQEMQETS